DGVLSGYDPRTGKELFKDRIGGRVSSSPVAWDGKAFFLRENGETVVIDPQAAEKVVAENRLGASDEEIFRASITPDRGRVFLRSDRVLYCVGGTQKTAAR
ncbi:MAG: PQQ-like beta-propeller repeat protein, partial [Planctomycetes bacterium]|nr:PQQ-like beta-propeller repeat protein [Planctomycetota bacterium]